MRSHIYERGQVWNAYIPYNDGPYNKGEDVGKKRPVIVVGWTKHGPNEDGNILVVPVTTFGGNPPKKLRAGQFEVSDLETAGLKASKRSFVLARRFITINSKSIDKEKGYRGTIADEEIAKIVAEIIPMISLPSERLIVNE